MTIESTLEERGSRYGDFTYHAAIAQALQDAMRSAKRNETELGWERLSPIQRQALTVIADKIARILSGDPNYADNWHGIQGYAKLVEDRLPGASGREPRGVTATVAPDLNALLSTAGFLALGAALAHKNIAASTKDALIAKGLSYDAYIEEVTKDAPLLEDAWVTHFAREGKLFDGIWMYEVVEEYGYMKGNALVEGKAFDSHGAIKKLIANRSY